MRAIYSHGVYLVTSKTNEGKPRRVVAEVVREGVTQRIVQKEVLALNIANGHKFILGYFPRRLI